MDVMVYVQVVAMLSVSWAGLAPGLTMEEWRGLDRLTWLEIAVVTFKSFPLLLVLILLQLLALRCSEVEFEKR